MQQVQSTEAWLVRAGGADILLVDLYELPTSVGPVDTVHAGGTPQAGGRGGQVLREQCSYAPAAGQGWALLNAITSNLSKKKSIKMFLMPSFLW